MNNKIQPETLLQLIISVLGKSSDFEYINGVQPFLMKFKNDFFYVYVKNLSSAYFNDRPDTTRAQLPRRDEFDTIKSSSIPFIFLGYDQLNDVLVCWNFYIVKKRLNEKKSVSFYSRKFYQEEVVGGELLRKKLKNDDVPVLFKRKDIILFFKNIHNFFEESGCEYVSEQSPTKDGKILSITDEALLAKLKPLLDISTPHTLEAIKVVQEFYGELPSMKFRDWANLVKTVTYKD